MNETYLLEISKQGPAVVVVALFLFAIYMIARMVVDGMKGYTETQEKLIKQLECFAVTIRAQTRVIEKQSAIINQLKEVIEKLYEELIRKAQIIKEYEQNKTNQAEIKKSL